MKLIVGLGNPGKQYEKTKHNTGFMVMDQLSKILQCPIDQKKFKALIGQCVIHGEKVLLMKPQTFMNLSGEAVHEAMKFYQLTPEDILIIYDDLDLPIGKLRLREQGSAGGQNGIKNIIAHIHTQDFKRIRVGIGNDKLMLTADYVLGKIPKSEWQLHQEAINKASEAAEASITKSFPDVMGMFNRK